MLHAIFLSAALVLDWHGKHGMPLRQGLNGTITVAHMVHMMFSLVHRHVLVPYFQKKQINLHLHTVDDEGKH